MIGWHCYMSPRSRPRAACACRTCRRHNAPLPNDDYPDLSRNWRYSGDKQRLTEEMRDRLIVRLRAMLPSALESKDLGYVSRQVVDTVFAAIDDEGRFGL
jgi:hypothetical protein